MSDAAVICAHTVFSEKSSSLPFRANELVEDVAVGLKPEGPFQLHSTWHHDCRCYGRY